MERISVVLTFILFLACKETANVPRKYKDITEKETIEVGTWKGWWIVSFPNSNTAIIRNNNRAIMIQRPKWMSEIWSEGDTIK